MLPPMEFAPKRHWAYSIKVPEGYLTVKEVAARLGVGEQRVRDLINAGRLPAEKLGESKRGVWVVKESDIHLVENRKPGRPSKRRKRQPNVRN